MNVTHHIQDSSVSNFSSDHNLFITVRDMSASNASLVRRVNWRFYHDELSRRLPSLPANPIVTHDDLDLRATNLHELVQGVIDRYTYALEVNHQKSAPPPEDLHAIWLRSSLATDGKNPKPRRQTIISGPLSLRQATLAERIL